MSRLAQLLPRSLQPRLEQIRRDLRTVVADLRGDRPPSYRPRSTHTRYVGATQLATRTGEVVEVVRETADAISLVLRDASGGEFPPLRPGQFLTLLVPVAGDRPLRRAYSISSDCRDRSRVRVTIKRVAGGRASNYLVDHAQVGMRLELLGPSGEFGVVPDASAHRKLVLIAGGSGITPMMAILHTLAELEPHSELVLVVGNRGVDDIVFARELEQLAARHAPRVAIVHALEQPPPDWTGVVGRLDAPTLDGILTTLPIAAAPACEFLLCGPAPLLAAAKTLLRERGIPDARVHEEVFLQPHLRDDQQRTSAPQPLTLVQRERELGLVVQPGQTLLEAGLAAGLAMPYSCTMGGCGACRVQLERGAVVMSEPNCLSEREREAGEVLACIASPTQPCKVRVP
jgi:ferredoxin-NADP reductase